MLGELQHEKADIGWGNLFVTLNRFDYMGFTSWHTLDNFCALVPKIETHPKIMALVLPFDMYVWTGLVILVVVGITFIMGYFLFFASHEQ